MTEPTFVPSGTRRPRSVRGLFASALTLLALLVVAPLAQAHSDIQSISPADQSTVDTSPAQIVLTFTDNVIGQFTQVEVRSDNVALDLPAPTSQGNVVTQTLPSALPAGAYTIVYRIVSADSHPISGQSTFTVTSGPSPSATESTVTPPISPSASNNASMPASSPNATAGAESSAPATAQDSSTGAMAIWVAVGVALLAAAVALGLARRRQAR